MPVTTDIVRSYRRPREVIRKHLNAGQREDRALAFVMGACVLMFVAQWPRLQREATMDPNSPPLEALLGTALQGWLFIMPLAFYLLAAFVHVIAKIFRGRGSWYSARIALFWSLLAVSPLVLFQGLIYGFLEPGPERRLADIILTAGFFWIWGSAVIESNRNPEASATS